MKIYVHKYTQELRWVVLSSTQNSIELQIEQQLQQQ